MRRFVPAASVVLLVYIAATLLLAPYARHVLPTESAPLSAAAAAQELRAIPLEAPLSLMVEPQDGTAQLLESIKGAAKSVDLVVYELQDPKVEQALADAAARGVAVRVILENLNSFGRHPNQDAYDFLVAHKVPVAWAPSYVALVHQKTLVIDGALAYIMTFNLQPQYYASSRDFGLVDTDSADVAAIEQTFADDWSGHENNPAEGRDLVWSPGSAPTLLALIAQASSTLDVYNEEMADPRITQALEDAAARGTVVRVVMTYATNWKQALNELVAHKVAVRTYSSSGKLYIHAKVIVADGAEAFVGSENFSTQSLDQNRELGVLLRRSDILDTLEAVFAKDWAAARPYATRM